MMRRLHVEDAHTSALAITNAKEGREARDEQSFESVASEFKSLLSKISTEYGALPDQSVALGFALAQSAAQQVHQRPERAPQVTEDDTRKDERGESNSEFTFLSEDDSTQRDIEEPLVERNVADGDSQKNLTREIGSRRSFEVGEADSKEVVTSHESMSIVPEAGDADKHELGASIANDLQPHGVDDSAVSAVPVEHSESSMLVKTFDDSQTSTVETFAAETVVKSEIEAEHQEDENPVDGPIMVADAEENVYREATVTKKVAQEKASVPDSVDKLRDLPIANDPKKDVYADQQDLNRLRDNEIAGGEEMLNATTKRSVRIGDVARTGADAENAQQFSPPEQFVARPMPKTDMTIQTALLRQAFERVQLFSGVDSKASKVSGVGEGIVPPQVSSSTTRTESKEDAPSAARSRAQSNMARMLERVDATLKEAARSRDGKSITLKLDPVDLGKVRVDVTLRDGKLHAKITPDNQDVMQSLRENAHDLQASLRKLGLEVDSVSVSIGLERFEDGESAQQFAGGSSFQEEGHNLPFEDGQVPENMFGNKFALDTQAGSSEGNPSSELDHWIA